MDQKRPLGTVVLRERPGLAILILLLDVEVAEEVDLLAAHLRWHVLSCHATTHDGVVQLLSDY